MQAKHSNDALDIGTNEGWVLNFLIHLEGDGRMAPVETMKRVISEQEKLRSEVRRLSALEQLRLEHFNGMKGAYQTVHDLNKELLVALKDAKANAGNPELVYQITSAIIAKAESRT